MKKLSKEFNDNCIHIELSVKGGKKKLFIKRQFHKIQLKATKYPQDIIALNIAQMAERMMEKIGEEKLLTIFKDKEANK